MSQKNIIITAWRDIWCKEAGGAEIYITKFAEYLASRGYKIRFLTVRYKDSKAREIVNGVEYIRIGSIFTYFIVAPLYLLLNFKEQTDILIESFAAIPFWSSYFVKNKILVFYHLHIYRTTSN